MYLLTEQLMKGTVTMQTFPIGIDTPTFAEAVIKVKTSKYFSSATIQVDNEYGFNYIISKPDYYTLHGRLENRPLDVI